MKIHFDVILNKHAFLVFVLLLTFSLMIGVLSACQPEPEPEPDKNIIDILDSVSIESSNNNPLYAKVGDTVTVEFKSKEKIKNVTVTINDKAADDISTDKDKRTWKATRTMNEDDTEGEVTFTIEFKDHKKNAYTQGATIGYTVIFDKTPPILGSVSIASSNDNPSYAKEDDTVTVSFTSIEKIQNVTVTINDKDADDISTDKYKRTWKATRTMNEDDTEGEVTFTIDYLEDLAGNAYTQGATTTDKVVFDKTSPIITGRVIEDATTSPDGTEWYFSNVTVHFEATDNLSDIADMTSDVPTFTLSLPTMDVTITTEGENQSVTGIATDKAGNTASFPVTGINIKKLIIVAVMAGTFNQDIYITVNSAAALENLELLSDENYVQVYAIGLEKRREAMDSIISFVSKYHDQFGANMSDIRVLLVGKSLGGAKVYSMLSVDYYEEKLAEFHKVGVVLVNAHEHGIPGDDGSPGKQYDYVYFSNVSEEGKYFDLAWRTRFSQSDQGDSDSKLRIFNIYSRRKYTLTDTASIKGYSFTSAYLNLNAENWGRDHTNIGKCRETRNLIQEAIRYLRY